MRLFERCCFFSFSDNQEISLMTVYALYKRFSRDSMLLVRLKLSSFNYLTGFCHFILLIYFLCSIF